MSLVLKDHFFLCPNCDLLIQVWLYIDPNFTICELFTHIFVFKLVRDGEYTKLVNS